MLQFFVRQGYMVCLLGLNLGFASPNCSRVVVMSVFYCFIMFMVIWRMLCLSF
jgi:hypothetical protein